MNLAEDLTSLTPKAKKGDTDAMLRLARVYYQGDHSDATRFFEWTRQAAEAGDTGAMFNLALAYFNGTGTAPSAWAAVMVQYSRGRLSPIMAILSPGLRPSAARGWRGVGDDTL